MDYKTLVDWYVSGGELNDEELYFLKNEYNRIISNITSLNSLTVAPNHICKKFNLAEKNYWISCLAILLDIYEMDKSYRNYNSLLKNKLEEFL